MELSCSGFRSGRVAGYAAWRIRSCILDTSIDAALMSVRCAEFGNQPGRPTVAGGLKTRTTVPITRPLWVLLRPGRHRTPGVRFRQESSAAATGRRGGIDTCDAGQCLGQAGGQATSRRNASARSARGCSARPPGAYWLGMVSNRLTNASIWNVPSLRCGATRDGCTWNDALPPGSMLTTRG